MVKEMNKKAKFLRKIVFFLMFAELSHNSYGANYQGGGRYQDNSMNSVNYSMMSNMNMNNQNIPYQGFQYGNQGNQLQNLNNLNNSEIGFAAIRNDYFDPETAGFGNQEDVSGVNYETMNNTRNNLHNQGIPPQNSNQQNRSHFDINQVIRHIDQAVQQSVNSALSQKGIKDGDITRSIKELVRQSVINNSFGDTSMFKGDDSTIQDKSYVDDSYIDQSSIVDEEKQKVLSLLSKKGNSGNKKNTGSSKSGQRSGHKRRSSSLQKSSQKSKNVPLSSGYQDIVKNITKNVLSSLGPVLNQISTSQMSGFQNQPGSQIQGQQIQGPQQSQMQRHQILGLQPNNMQNFNNQISNQINNQNQLSQNQNIYNQDQNQNSNKQNVQRILNNNLVHGNMHNIPQSAGLPHRNNNFNSQNPQNHNMFSSQVVGGGMQNQQNHYINQIGMPQNMQAQNTSQNVQQNMLQQGSTNNQMNYMQNQQLQNHMQGNYLQNHPTNYQMGHQVAENLVRSEIQEKKNYFEELSQGNKIVICEVSSDSKSEDTKFKYIKIGLEVRLFMEKDNVRYKVSPINGINSDKVILCIGSQKISISTADIEKTKAIIRQVSGLHMLTMMIGESESQYVIPEKNNNKSQNGSNTSDNVSRNSEESILSKIDDLKLSPIANKKNANKSFNIGKNKDKISGTGSGQSKPRRNKIFDQYDNHYTDHVNNANNFNTVNYGDYANLTQARSPINPNKQNFYPNESYNAGKKTPQQPTFQKNQNIQYQNAQNAQNAQNVQNAQQRAYDAFPNMEGFRIATPHKKYVDQQERYKSPLISERDRQIYRMNKNSRRNEQYLERQVDNQSFDNQNFNMLNSARYQNQNNQNNQYRDQSNNHTLKNMFSCFEVPEEKILNVHYMDNSLSYRNNKNIGKDQNSGSINQAIDYQTPKSFVRQTGDFSGQDTQRQRFYSQIDNQTMDGQIMGNRVIGHQDENYQEIDYDTFQQDYLENQIRNVPQQNMPNQNIINNQLSNQGNITPKESVSRSQMFELLNNKMEEVNKDVQKFNAPRKNLSQNSYRQEYDIYQNQQCYQGKYNQISCDDTKYNQSDLNNYFRGNNQNDRKIRKPIFIQSDQDFHQIDKRLRSNNYSEKFPKNKSNQCLRNQFYEKKN